MRREARRPIPEFAQRLGEGRMSLGKRSIRTRPVCPRGQTGQHRGMRNDRVRRLGIGLREYVGLLRKRGESRHVCPTVLTDLERIGAQRIDRYENYIRQFLRIDAGQSRNDEPCAQEDQSGVGD